MKIRNIIFVLSCFFSGSVFAGETTGKVNLLYVHGYNDFILFSMISAQPGFASCAVTGRYAISTSTQQGKNIFSTILAAKAANLTITVSGKSTCTTHGDAEDISAIVVN
ncbi:MAG: hypothetical protein EOO52_12090 [Gammaproteobacteria bacterium]|nr:MAG: hypothetical protein EOO52_12090 [Gammaproteobacteria bacterium]